MVRAEGLEPSHLSITDFKSVASTVPPCPLVINHAGFWTQQSQRVDIPLKGLFVGFDMRSVILEGDLRVADHTLLSSTDDIAFLHVFSHGGVLRRNGGYLILYRAEIGLHS